MHKLMKPRKVFSFNSELYKVTGVQRVLMDVHHAVQDEYEAKIVGTISYGQVHKDLGIRKSEYIRWCNPFLFRKSIVILHERKFLLLFWLLNHLLFQRIKLVYIHHNVFNNHRRMSVMPETVVAISDEGVENLHRFFRVPLPNIHKIYNCVKDIHPDPHKPYEGGEVSILYPARINDVKRQTEIVKQLDGKLATEIKILFAGTGPEVQSLQEAIRGKNNFEYLGYRSDIYQLLQECNYIMLFSQHEGLPITLIESAMCGTPAICNDVGGNPEIVCNNISGFVLDKDDWNGLIQLLNELPNLTTMEYQAMSSNSRKKYLKSFTFDRFKQNYCALLQTL